jgi:hypothetical protein
MSGDRVHIETVNEVDLRLRAPGLHDHGDTDVMPVLGAQMFLKELRTSGKQIDTAE